MEIRIGTIVRTFKPEFNRIGRVTQVYWNGEDNDNNLYMIRINKTKKFSRDVMLYEEQFEVLFY